MSAPIMIRLKTASAFALASIVAMLIAQLVFIFDDEYILNISKISTSECNYIWQLLLTNMVVNLLCIAPFSILLTPLKMTKKTQYWIIVVTSCVMVFFGGLTTGLMKDKCVDYYASSQWILTTCINITMPGLTVLMGIILIGIHLGPKYCPCYCNCDCTCTSCANCMEDYELCCNTCCKKYEEQEESV